MEEFDYMLQLRIVMVQLLDQYLTTTREVFADSAGISRSHLSTLLRGTVDIRMSTFLKFCIGIRKCPWTVMIMAWGDHINFKDMGA